MKYEVACEGKSGYRSVCDTEDDARHECADILGIDADEMVEVIVDSDCHGGLEMWCYASQDDADADDNGGYGPIHRPLES